MIVQFFYTADDPRVLSKSLTSIITVSDVTPKSDLTIMEPIIELAYNPAIETSNYLSFDGRYYYIRPEGIVRSPGSRVIVLAALDVLKTFDTQIRALHGIPARVEDPAAADWYLHDSRQPVRAYRSIVTRPGNDMYFDTAHFLLLTAG